MRPFLSASIGALAVAGCAGHHEGHGPAGIPYDCSGGRAVVIYEGGGYYPRGSAQLHYRGQTISLVALLPTYGLRYQEDRALPALVWSARGESAWLARRTPDHEEHEIARCTRDRTASGGHGEEPPAEAAGDHH